MIPGFGAPEGLGSAEQFDLVWIEDDVDLEETLA